MKKNRIIKIIKPMRCLADDKDCDREGLCEYCPRNTEKDIIGAD